VEPGPAALRIALGRATATWTAVAVVAADGVPDEWVTYVATV